MSVQCKLTVLSSTQNDENSLGIDHSFVFKCLSSVLFTHLLSKAVILTTFASKTTSVDLGIQTESSDDQLINQKICFLNRTKIVYMY